MTFRTGRLPSSRASIGKEVLVHERLATRLVRSVSADGEGLRADYSLSAEQTAFFDYFAPPPVEFEERLLEGLGGH